MIFFILATIIQKNFQLLLVLHNKLDRIILLVFRFSYFCIYNVLCIVHVVLETLVIFREFDIKLYGTMIHI